VAAGEPPPAHHARSLTVDSADEATLSEKELRDLYDDEEIDRFLRLFSAVGCSVLYCQFIDPSPPQHVNEVKLDDCGQPKGNAELSAAVDGIVAEDPDDNDDKEWVSLNELGENLGLPHGSKQPQTISEQIAQVSGESSLHRTILMEISEIRRAVPPKNDNEDPTIYSQQTSSYGPAAILGPGAWIPVCYRPFGLACDLGG